MPPYQGTINEGAPNSAVVFVMLYRNGGSIVIGYNKKTKSMNANNRKSITPHNETLKARQVDANSGSLPWSEPEENDLAHG